MNADMAFDSSAMSASPPGRAIASWAAAALLLALAVALPCTSLHAAEDDDGRVALYLKARDPNGGKLFFKWNQVEGPPVKINNPTAARLEDGKWVSETYFIPVEPGKYIFEVSVKNEEGEETKQKISRDVMLAAPRPIAVAGDDQDVLLGQTVVLNGVKSRTADGRAIREWEWRVIEAPEKFKLDPRALKERMLDFKTTIPGKYMFELRVKDDTNFSDPSRLNVTVRKQSKPPEIDVEPKPKTVEIPPPPGVHAPELRAQPKPVVKKGYTVKLGETITLDGSASTADPADHFFWRQERGTVVIKTLTPDTTRKFNPKREDTLNYPVVTCRPAQPGEYVFVMEIAPGKNGRDDGADRVQSEPVFFTVVDPVGHGIGEISGNGGKPPITTPPSERPEVGPTPPPDDPKVQVIDIPKNDRPIAKIKAERSTVEAGDIVKLDASESKDPEGKPLSFIWGPVAGKRSPRQWIDSQPGEKAGPMIEFKAEEVGEYGIAVTVSDGDMIAQDQVVVTVGPANQPPRVKVAPKFETRVKEGITITAEVSDPENDRLTVKWTCDDPANLQIPPEYSDKAALRFIPMDPGLYVFRVTVTDARGRTDSTTTQVGVKERENLKPAAIIAGPANANTGDPIKLDASRSSDPEKQALSFFWKQEKVEGGPTIPGTAPGDQAKEWAFTPTEAGLYRISLTVSDGVNKSDTQIHEINIARLNKIPVAAITVPEGGKFMMGESAVVDGSTSSDPDSDKLTFKWALLDARPGVELIDSTAPKATVKSATAGPVKVMLTVNDGTVDSQPVIAELAATRPNNKPIAKITGPNGTPRVGNFVELSAGQSSDPDNDALTTFIWTQPADGGPETGLRGKDLRQSTLRFRPERPGTYVFNLEVVDSEGGKSDPVSAKFEVKGQNLPPVARVGIVPPGERVYAGREIKLSGRGSLDPEGGPLTYKWRKVSGPPIEMPADLGEIINLVLPAAGQYQFELVVNDGENDSNPVPIVVAATIPNAPPTVVVAEIPQVETGEKVWLDASQTRDDNGDKLEFRWTQISGPEVRWRLGGQGKPRTDITLNKPGEYVFELKVSDGKEWTEKKVVAKTRSANVPPNAIIANGAVKTAEEAETVLDASPSNDPDSGPNPLSYTWEQIEGPTVSIRSSGAIARFTPKTAGNYAFQVKVFDGKHMASAVARATVVAAGLLPVAVPAATPNPVQVARKDVKKTNDILILDGTRSQPQGKKLTYLWAQVAGDDLRLQPAQLGKDRVGLRIFHPGQYRFSLIVSDGENTSQPAYVDVTVSDDAGSGPGPAARKEEQDTNVEKKDGQKGSSSAIPRDPPTRLEALAPAPVAPAPVATENRAAVPTERVAPPPTVIAKKTPLSEPPSVAMPPAPPRTSVTPTETAVADPVSAAEKEEGTLLAPPRDASSEVAGLNMRPAGASPEKLAEMRKLEDLALKEEPEAEKTLVTSLSNPDTDIRCAAASALARRGVNSIPALIAVMESDCPLARKQALDALVNLTHQNLGASPAAWKKWWSEQPAARSVSKL